MEQEVVTVGLDLAKNVFQVHAIAADGAVLIRRKLRRTEVIRFFAKLSPYLVGMEACASAHHWSSLVVMTNRSDRGLVKVRGSQRFERDDVIREPTCGLHQGQQPCGAARTGRTHGCTRPRSSMPKALALRRSSTTSRHRHLSTTW